MLNAKQHRHGMFEKSPPVVDKGIYVDLGGVRHIDVLCYRTKIISLKRIELASHLEEESYLVIVVSMRFSLPFVAALVFRAD